MLEFAHSPSVSRPPSATTPPFSIYGCNFQYAYTSQIVCRRIDSVCVWMMQKILSIALNWNDNDALSKRQEIPAATDDRSLNKRTHKKSYIKRGLVLLAGYLVGGLLTVLAGWLAGRLMQVFAPNRTVVWLFAVARGCDCPWTRFCVHTRRECIRACIFMNFVPKNKLLQKFTLHAYLC